jgi:hypothetical protein
MSSTIRIMVIAAAACALAAPALAAPAFADVAPPSQVLSDFENYWGASLARDCGWSEPLPANPSDSLWVFCDTDVWGLSDDQYQLTQVINGSTAAEGPYTAGEVPTGLSEIPSPGDGAPTLPSDEGPAQFLSNSLPAGDSTTCSGYQAAWPSGISTDPGNAADVLIPYQAYCVDSSTDYLPEAVGIATYDPASNTVTSNDVVFTDLWSQTAAAAAPLLLGSPIVSGGYLYLYGYYCAPANQEDDACVSGTGNAVYLARVPASGSQWNDMQSYRWYDGSGWSTSSSAATSVLTGSAPQALTVASYSSLGHGLVLIEQTGGGGQFTAYSAAAPTGSWTQIVSGTVPCTATSGANCHALIGHPELSTSSDLLISYFNPSSGPGGHDEVAAFPW